MARSSTTAKPGDMLALKHGGRSSRIVAERTHKIVAEWTDPDSGLQLSQPVDKAALWATATAMARLEEYTAYIEALDSKGRIRGALDARGRPRGCMAQFWTAYRAVMSGLDALGATPSGRAKMATGVAAARGLAGQLAARRLELTKEAAS